MSNRWVALVRLADLAGIGALAAAVWLAPVTGLIIVGVGLFVAADLAEKHG